MHCLLPSAVTSVLQMHGSKEIIYRLNIEQIFLDIFLNAKEFFFKLSNILIFRIFVRTPKSIKVFTNSFSFYLFPPRTLTSNPLYDS